MPTFVPSDVQIKNNPTLMVVDAKRVKGSYMVFADTAARDALDPSVRQSGMKVRTLSPDSEWTLNNDLTNWTAAVSAGAGGENGEEHRVARIAELYATRDANPVYYAPDAVQSLSYRRASSGLIALTNRDAPVWLERNPPGIVDGQWYLRALEEGDSAVTVSGGFPQAGRLFTHAEYTYILGLDGNVYDTLSGNVYTAESGDGLGATGGAATVQYITGAENPQVGIFVLGSQNITPSQGIYLLEPGAPPGELTKIFDLNGVGLSPFDICAADGFSFWIGYFEGVLRKYSYGTLGVGNFNLTPQEKISINLPHTIHNILFDGRYVWALGYQYLSRVSENGTVTTVPVATPGQDVNREVSMAYDGLTVWITLRGGYVRVDPETMKFLSQNYDVNGPQMAEIVVSPDLDNSKVYYLDRDNQIIYSLLPHQQLPILKPVGAQVGSVLHYSINLADNTQKWDALQPGASGQFLKSNGPGINAEWASTRSPVVTVSGTSYSATIDDSVILCSNTGNTTVFLPTVALYVGKSLVIKNVSGVTTNFVQVNAGAGIIESLSSTFAIVPPKGSMEFVYQGSNSWQIVGQYGAATNLFFQSEFQGDITYRSTNAWARLAAGTAGQVLRTNGAGLAPAWTNQLLFTGESQGDIAYRNATTWVRLPAGTAGQVLTTGGAGANPSWAAGGGGGGASPDNAVSDRFSSAGKSSGFLGLPTSSPSLTTAFVGFGTGYRGAAFDDQFIYWLDPTAQGVYLTDAVSPGFGGGSGPNQLLFVSAAYQQILYLGYQRGSSNVKRFVMMGTGGVRFFDYNTSTATATLGVQSISTSVAGGWFDGNNLWVVLNSAGTNQVQRINTVLRNSGSPTITTITGTGTVFSKNTQLFSPIITSDGTNLWVIDQRASSGTFSLYKIVMSSGTVTSNAWAGGVIDPRSICFDGRYLWVGGISSTVYRCDPTATNPTPGTAIQMTEGGTVNGGAGGGSTVDNILWDGRRVILSMSDCTSTTANSVFAIDPDYASQLTDPGNTFVGAVQGINGPRGLVASNQTSGGASTIYVIATSGLHRITEPLPVEATDLVVRGVHIDTNSRTVSGASVSYNILQSDYIINVNATGSTFLTLPTSPRVGYQCIVKDISGAASVNNINIGATSGSLEGNSSFNGYVIGTNYGSIGLIHLGSNVWVTF